MNRNMGGIRCLAGFVMLALAHFTGSFCWIARLLGYMGIANGTTDQQENGWMRCTYQVSTLAVIIFAVLEVLRLTSIFVLPTSAAILLECVLAVTCGVCVLMGVGTQKKEDNE